MAHPSLFSSQASPTNLVARVRFGETIIYLALAGIILTLGGVGYSWLLYQDTLVIAPVIGTAVALGMFLVALNLLRNHNYNLATLAFFAGMAVWLYPLVLTFARSGPPAFFILIAVLLTFSLRVADTNRGPFFGFLSGFVAIAPIVVEYFTDLQVISLPDLFQWVAWSISMVVSIPALVVLGRNFDALQLQSRLTFIMLFVGIVPLGVLGLVSNLFTREALISAAEDQLLGDARQVANVVDTFINFTLDSVRTESRLLDVVKYMEALAQADRAPTNDERLNVDATLRELARKDPVFIASYALVDAFGIVRLSTVESEVGLDWSQRDFVRVPLRQNVPYVSNVFIETNQGQLYFAAPVRARTGQVVGLLVAHYRADVLQDRVRRSSGEFAEGYQAALVDADNIRLAQSAFPQLVYTLLAPPSQEIFDALQQAGRLPQGTRTQLSTQADDLVSQMDTLDSDPVFTSRLVTTGDEANLVAVVRLQNPASNPWRVIYAQEQRFFLAPVENQVRNVLVTGILSALGIAVVASTIARLAAAPLINLTETAARIGRGDLSARATVQGRDEVATLAQTFNRTAAQLQDTLTGLERRVQERTRALQTSVEVSRRLSTILDQDELLNEVVTQVKNAFNYYHTQIYLLDETRTQLVLAGGTGEAGQAMLERRHRLALGRGVVGRAAQTNQSVLVSDVSRDPAWLPNPLLPDTRSEMAVPIAIGEMVLGVLDVQHNVAGGLTSDDLELIQSLANQVAVALQNTRAYATTRQQARREALLNTINQKILSTTSIEEALQVTARELGEATRAHQAHVQLRRPTVEPPAN